AASCHAAWVPISSGIVKGRRMTSYASVKDDCINAGATWVDKECGVDGTFITSCHPGDFPAFCRAIVSVLSKWGWPLCARWRMCGRVVEIVSVLCVPWTKVQ